LSTGQRDSLERASQALRDLPGSEPARAAELLMTGQALLITDSRAAAVPVLRRALTAFRNEPLAGEDQMQGLLYACLVAIGLWEDESWHVLSARHVQLALVRTESWRSEISTRRTFKAIPSVGQPAVIAHVVEMGQSFLDACFAHRNGTVPKL